MSVRKSLEHWRSEHKSIPREEEKGWEWWGLKDKDWGRGNCKRRSRGTRDEGEGGKIITKAHFVQNVLILSNSYANFNFFI